MRAMVAARAAVRAADRPHWTVATIEARIVEAVDTLKRVPAPDIQRAVTRWPEFIRDAGRIDVHGRRRRPVADPAGAAPDGPSGALPTPRVGRRRNGPGPWLISLCRGRQSR